MTRRAAPAPTKAIRDSLMSTALTNSYIFVKTFCVETRMITPRYSWTQTAEKLLLSVSIAATEAAASNAAIMGLSLLGCVTMQSATTS